MKRILFFLMLFISTHVTHGQQITEDNIQEVIAKMTLEEKAKMVVGAGMKMPGVDGAAVGSTEDKVPGAAGTSQPIPRLGIPKVVMADGPAGVRIDPKRASDPDNTFYATGFPVATVLASSFNLPLMEEVGAAYGNEVKEYGVDILLAPALNLHRNPLGGRNFEYYSEDPVVSGKMAAAFVKGLQSQNVGATVKHFAANNQETNRTKINTILSERALREIYLKGFEIAIKESDPWCVMSSYNKINEEYASESAALLKTILRDEWNFDGFVMTDWFGGEDASKQMKAGNDLLMPGTPKQEADIINAVKNGTLSEKELDKNVASILSVYVKTPTFRGYSVTNKPNLKGHKVLAKQAAAEGMVLLKNDRNTLPLTNVSGTVALLGVGSYETIAGGTGSGDVNKAYTVSIEEGLRKKSVPLSSALTTKYQQYITKEKAKIPAKRFFFEPDKVVPELDWTEAQLDSIASNSSLGIFTVTRTSGEFEDRRIENDFNLSDVERNLIKKIADAFHKKNKRFTVLLNIGGVIETASWKEHPDAILVVWQPGQEGGHAVADVLTGTVNPSGKLTMTFPLTYEDVPSAKNFPGKELEPKQETTGFTLGGVKSEVVYEEDIFVGYRYYDTFNKAVSYPFGYGLSYTAFAFSDMKVASDKNGDISISCTVRNTGQVPGKEVVQLYITAPEGKLAKPARELKAFTKTSELKPGQEQKVTLTLTPAQLASYDENESAWITEAGTYTFMVGSSLNNLPIKKTHAVNKQSVFKTNKVLTPARKINTMGKRQ